MDDVKLKPCPFCGGKASLKFEDGKFGWPPDLNYVKCVECGARGSVYYSDLRDELYKAKLAIAAWNRRSTDEQ